jgi:hypothetical protein
MKNSLKKGFVASALLLWLFASCAAGMTVGEIDEYYLEEIQGLKLYDADYGDIQLPGSVSKWLIDNIEYEVARDWPQPEDVYKNRKADCKGLAIMAMNIAYLELGIEYDLALVSTPGKTIAGGDIPNHACLMLDGELKMPLSLDATPDYLIEYWYTFDQVFKDAR